MKLDGIGDVHGQYEKLVDLRENSDTTMTVALALHRQRNIDILIAQCISKWRHPMQVSKWGNSLAVRLPAAVVEALGLKEGDMLEIQIAGRRVFEVAKAPDARGLLARLRKFRGRLPATFKFDRLEANERR